MKKIFLFAILLCFLVIKSTLAIDEFSKVYEATQSNVITARNNQCERLYTEISPGETTSLEICSKSYKVTFKSWTGELATVETGSGEYNVSSYGLSIQPEEINPPLWFHIYPLKSSGKIGISVEEVQSNCRVPDCVYGFDIDIKKGWNLISAIAIDDIENPEIGTCTREDFPNQKIFPDKYMFFYEPFLKRYISGSNFWTELRKYYTDSEINANPIMIGSFWLYSTRECELISIYTQNDTRNYWLNEVAKRNVAFPAGWNFFSVTSDMEGKTFDQIKGSCEITKMYIWNPNEQSWKIWEIGSKFSSKNTGYGFLFKTSNNCKLGEISPVVSPPPLPG